MERNESGSSLIDLMIALGIIILLFGGIYLVFFSILGATSNIEARTAAVELLNRQIETIRGMSYDSVGTAGGIPAGGIPQTQVLSVGNYTFTLNTTIRNIDDPFDGTATGNPPPVDTAPADYKLVELEIECSLCIHFVPFLYTTTVAPQNLEAAGQNGSIFINVFDAFATGVNNAVVHVTNNLVTPSIDLIDTTNASGVLALVGVPTSSQSYHVTVTDNGYSSDQTYPIGGQAGPNPLKPDATVAAQTVTSVSFAIDKVSTVNVYSSTDVCAPISNRGFSMQGSKLIGNPNVLKFSTSSVTTASGTRSLSNIEWDTYSITPATSSYDLEGTIPLSPMTVNPNTSLNFRFVLKLANDPSLLMTITDAASGNGITGASVVLTGPSSRTLITGHAIWTDTTWSGSNYASQDGGINTESTPGIMTLLANASGTYTVAPADWLISKTIDLGGSSSTIYSVSWNPVNQSQLTGAGSLKIQLAANNDNQTWNFIGPDGTANTYFTVSSSTPSALNGNEYLRYKVFLMTADTSTTPELDDISFDFTSICVPSAQSLFTNLSQGSYTFDVTAPNYAQASGSISIGAGFQETSVQLTHL